MSIRAIGLLTGAMLQRLAREGLVLRSLAFPTPLVIGALLMTIGVVAWLRWEPTIALSPEHADLAPTLEAARMHTRVAEDPHALVEAGEVWGAVDGADIWIAGSGPQALALEAAVRDKLGAAWRPDAEVPLPAGDSARRLGDLVVILFGMLFALYGVVFGAGMVARDRDDGTLEAELALPLPRWIHGLVRLLVGATALSGFLVLGILMVDAVIGLTSTAATVRHGVATAVGSTCIGLVVIGRGGLQNGFTGPLTYGMAIATALVAIGLAGGPVAKWIPLASFASSASGWEALVGAVGVAGITVWIFTLRSTRA